MEKQAPHSSSIFDDPKCFYRFFRRSYCCNNKKSYPLYSTLVRGRIYCQLPQCLLLYFSFVRSCNNSLYYKICLFSGCGRRYPNYSKSHFTEKWNHEKISYLRFPYNRAYHCGFWRICRTGSTYCCNGCGN